MIFKPAAAGVVSVLMFAVSRVALAQNGTMINGGGWMSGYGGMGDTAGY